MDELSLLFNLAVLALTAGLCSVIFTRLKLPPIIGYIFAGIILGNAFMVSKDGEAIVSIFSGIGLVLLMYCIGLEINLERLKKKGKFALSVVMIQIPLMLLFGYLVGSTLGLGLVASLCLGAIVSGSSTAVVLAVLKNNGSLTKDETETLIIVLIVEDIGQVVLLSVLTPMFTGMAFGLGAALMLILQIVLFMGLSVAVGLLVVPRILNWIGDKTNDEVLMIVSVGICFGLAFLSNYIGLSAAIGAFIVGMVTSQCTRSDSIQKRVEPMKELFMAMFFISIGTKVMISSLVNNIPTMLVVLGVFLLGTLFAIFIAYFILGKDGKTSFMSAIGLLAMGEFAFIIAQEGLNLGAINQGFYTAVIGAALASMIILPLISKAAPKIYTTAETKSPKWLVDTSYRIKRFRDDAYARTEASGSIREIVHSKLKYIYVDLILIVVVTILFSYLSPTIINFLSNRLDGNGWLACLLCMLLNYIALAIPTAYLISGLKGVNKMLIEGGKKMMNIPNVSEEKRTDLYKELSKFNGFILLFIIDTLMIMLVSGYYDVSEFLYLLPITAIILFTIYLLSFKKRWRKMYPPNLDACTQPAEEKTDTEDDIKP